mgnify:FL=1
MYWLYNILIILFAPIWAPWMWWRAWKRGEQPDWKERQGMYQLPTRKDGKRVWVHAVSVGEVVASMPILREVKKLLPDYEIVLSVTTSSGHQTARQKASDLYDHLVYFPIDVARFQLAAMQRVRPSVIAVMETELWFNFLWAAETFEARTLLINGRISDRSFPRSKKIGFFYPPLLKFLNRALMQTKVDADRIRELGAQNVEVLGNCKFDQAVEGLDADPAQWRKELGLVEGKPILVIGSTRGAEEENFVLDAVEKVGLDRIQVVHAPRHMESIPDLAKNVEKRFGTVALRSKKENGPYLLLDTYGELSKVYSVADLVVIGGGFSNLGGQNLIQPLAHGKPVIHGPHMQNFRDAAESALHAGATVVCSDPDQLAATLQSLLGDAERRQKMSDAAKALVDASLGASARYARAIADEALRQR